MQNPSSLSLLDLLTPSQNANPYPLYHQLRSHDPVYWDERLESWVLTRYSDIVPALRDRRFSAARLRRMIDPAWLGAEMQSTLGPALLTITRQMLFLDPPDHTRLRSLVAKAFTPRVLAALRPRIQSIADQLLDAVQDQGYMDVMKDFASPLPAMVIAEMLGVPAEDREQFISWSMSFGLLLDSRRLGITPRMQAIQDVVAFLDYFRQIIVTHRSAPRDDLMQALVQASEQGDRLSEEELLGNALLLLAAGHATTTFLIGNGMLALLTNPDQLQELQTDPTLIDLAVMELLRYDSPIQLTSRIAREALEMGGRQIQAGQEVIFVLGAANRDPAQFAEPDRLWLRRQENRHLAFGQGIHICLGAPLARIEGEIAFTTLLRRLQTPVLSTTEPHWLQSVLFRGVESIPLTFRSIWPDAR